MTPDDLYENPDTDIARGHIILSHVLSAIVFALVAVGALVFSHPSRLFWVAFFAALIYWADRKLFISRLWELNERLKRMEHKLNVISRAAARN